MFQVLAKVSCGNLTGIPSKFPKLSSDIFLLIEIAVPVLLVIMGMVDLFKAIVADKEDEMTKGRKMFVKRLIIGVLVFFLFAITKAIVGFFDNKASSNSIISCMDCFISNKCNVDNTIDVYEIKDEPKEVPKEEKRTVVEVEVDKVTRPSKTKLDKKTGAFTENYSNVNYYLYIPENATKGMPLVIFLHGIGEKGNMSAVKNLKPVTIITDGTLSGLEEFIFLAPTSPSSTHWGDYTTWNNLINLIDYITTEYSIDTSRIYLTGFSAGGCGVWGLVNKYPNKFKAAVAVSCTPSNITYANFKNTPLYAISGGNEGYVTGMQNTVNSINSAGGKAQFKTIPNADHIATQNSYSTKELYKWLLSQ